LDALSIYKQASMQKTSGTELVLQVAPNWCPTLLIVAPLIGARIASHPPT